MRSTITLLTILNLTILALSLVTVVRIATDTDEVKLKTVDINGNVQDVRKR